MSLALYLSRVRSSDLLGGTPAISRPAISAVSWNGLPGSVGFQPAARARRMIAETSRGVTAASPEATQASGRLVVKVATSVEPRAMAEETASVMGVHPFAW